MVTAAEKNGRVVQMGTQWRSGEHFKEAIDFVHSGKLGKIRMVRAWAYLDWVGGIGNPPTAIPPPASITTCGSDPRRRGRSIPTASISIFRWFWDYAGGLMTDWGVHLINLAMWGMGAEHPERVYSAGGKHVLTDNTETPDTQIAVYDFPSYTFVWEHQILGGVGIGGRPHGLSFSGSDATLILDSGGWEVIPEKEKGVAAVTGKSVTDGRPAHVKNFLDCVKSRGKPVENLELGHFVSTVAHLGNVAFRAGSQIAWDPEKEKIRGDRRAGRLLKVKYRKPWKMAYYRG